MIPKLSERTPLQISKHSKGLCATKFCTREHVKKKWFCVCCANRIWIARDPLRNTYKNLKGNAKRRGKDFTLTLDEFKIFAKKTNYMRKKGVTAKSMTIDRKDETKGYHFNNIQGISLRENIYKHKLHVASKKLKEETPF